MYHVNTVTTNMYIMMQKNINISSYNLSRYPFEKYSLIESVYGRNIITQKKCNKISSNIKSLYKYIWRIYTNACNKNKALQNK